MPEDREELEWKTRRKRIDPKLKDLGWAPTKFDERQPLGSAAPSAITEWPTEHGPADYALAAGAQVLGVVEAKKVSLGPQNVLVQAERYSKGAKSNPLRFGDFRVPFLYSTNGEVTWFHDIRHHLNRSRKVANFHTPSALREMLGRDFDGACRWFGKNANKHPRLRPYQVEANAAIEKAIADRKRTMLVAMATGTGKTFMSVNEVYRLLESGVARRILFLVDRRALAAQAVRAFASFEPEPGKKFNQIYEVYSQRFQKEDFGEEEKFDPKVLPSEYLTDPKEKHTFVYVCTIQRMAINLFGRAEMFEADEEGDDEEDGKLAIPIHAFDVVIADECHRGYTTAELSTWRNTLDHFDAIKIGLTATPAAHTKAYFTDVVFRYEYQRAVREGHLVDYDVVAIKSNVRMKGVFLKTGDHVKLVNPEDGSEQMDLLEDERAYEATEIERRVTAPDSNRKIVETIKKYADEHRARYGRWPKTLIFAANDLPHTSHADQLVGICRDVFGQGDAFVTKITGSATVDRPLQRIREFRNRPNPVIAVSVDLMSTGVDIPDLEYIVFLRPVKSRILFEQMLGRGTRKGEKYPDKSRFTVFDCFDGSLIAYFREATGITADPPERPARTIKEVIEDIWQNRDRAYNARCLVRRLQRIDKEMSGKARELFAAHVHEGDLCKFARELPGALAKDFSGTMKILRDEDFQELCVKYPRPKREFVVADGVEDEVESRWLIRDGTGKEYKPEDYLVMFARWVTENPAQVEAIKILLNRPQQWGTDALTELRNNLKSTKEHFTEEHLQKAHAACYKKDLVDIISMVKHAAREKEPLLTAEERVDRALEGVTNGLKVTGDQKKWLARIREHMIQNLSIDREDFDTFPILAREGGWKPADRAFDGSLSKLIKKLNEGVAA